MSVADEIDVSKVWTVDEQRAETGQEPFEDETIGKSLLKGGNVNISTDGI